MSRDHATDSDRLSELESGPAVVTSTSDRSPYPEPRRSAHGFAYSSCPPGVSNQARIETGQAQVGRRVSAQHDASREQADCSEAVAKALDRLTRYGARVLHDRQTPDGHGHVDHIVINRDGIHLVETLPVSDKNRVWVDVDGVPRVGETCLGNRLKHLCDVANDLADATNALIDRASDLPVYKVLAVVGGPRGQAFNSHDTDLVSLDLVPLWVSRLTGTHDTLDVAAVTATVSQVCLAHRREQPRTRSHAPPSVSPEGPRRR